MFKFDLEAHVSLGDESGVVIGRQERRGEEPSYEVLFPKPLPGGGGDDLRWIVEGSLAPAKGKPKKAAPKLTSSAPRRSDAEKARPAAKSREASHEERRLEARRIRARVLEAVASQAARS